MPDEPARRPAPVDRALRLVSDVRAGEGGTALLMTLNVFVVMVSYYVIKTVREPLILASGGDQGLPFPISGPEGKAYAAAVQALVLIPATRLYATLVSRWPVRTLIRRVLFFFVGCLLAFYGAAQVGAPYLGFLFFVWVGVFNVAAIAQFWAFANDLYRREVGERIFPVVMVGMALGGFVGGEVAAAFFRLGVSAFSMMPIAAAILVLHYALYGVILRREEKRRGGTVLVGNGVVSRGGDAGADSDVEVGVERADQSLGESGAFALIARSPYLMRIAGMLVLANLVNTTGEYILGAMVAEEAVHAPNEAVFIGEFFGSYYGRVSLLVLLVQLFLTSRVVKYGGIRALVLALPLVALSAYGLIAYGAGLAAVRWAKTAENTTDYSIMGTAKAMLWLPTTREEKYKAKLAIDTVFVRLGDVLAGGLVALGVHVFGFARSGFALANVGFIVVWLWVAWGLASRYLGALGNHPRSG